MKDSSPVISYHLRRHSLCSRTTGSGMGDDGRSGGLLAPTVAGVVNTTNDVEDATQKSSTAALLLSLHIRIANERIPSHNVEYVTSVICSVYGDIQVRCRKLC
ncbi:hypothetical protein Trydic_g17912 [Trypoxylus dichotomus]